MKKINTFGFSLIPTRFMRPAALVCACVLSAQVASNVGATVIYWDPNGTTSVGGNGTWDTTTKEWSTASTQSAAASLVAWNSADAADFCAGPATTFEGTFTVNVNSAITLGGIFNGSLSPGPCNVTLNGMGSLNLNLAGPAGFSTANGTGGVTTINVPITGIGQVNPQSSGSLFLYGTNTYNGGTLLSGSGGVNFNNNSSFGTGTITWGVTGGVLATPVNNGFGSAGPTGPLTLPNPVATFVGNSGSQIFVGIPTAPVTFTGTWTLPPEGITTFQNQPAGTLVVISNAIGGLAGFTKAGAGTVVFGGTNTYGGPTTVSAGILQLSNSAALPLTPASVTSGAVLDLYGSTNINTALTVGGTGISSGGALINSSASPASLIASSGVAGVTVTGGGSAITAPASVSFSGGGGGGAAASPNLGLTVATFTITAGTQKYTAVPTVVISGGGGSGSSATVALSGTSPAVISTTLTLTSIGGGYTSTPTVSFTGGTVSGSGTAPTITANGTHFTLNNIQVTAPGSGYTSAPTVSLSSGTSVTAVAKLTGVTLSATTSMGGTGGITINSPISGLTFGLTKIGADSLIIGGADTYTGATGVTAGTLALGGGSIGASAVTVSSGATLANITTNTGTVGGNTAFNSGSPGGEALFTGNGSAVGQISVTGTVALNNTPVTVNVAGTTLAGGTYRLMTASGVLTGAANSNPTITGIALPAGYVATVTTTTNTGGHVDLIVNAPPTVSCPSNITDTNASGDCGQFESFSATSTGYPASTVVYTIPGPTTITSPYFFPVGTTTVTATATNGIGSAATCQFTVTVTNSTPPVPGSFSLGAVDGTSSTFNTAKMLSLASSPVGGTLTVSAVVSPTPGGATVTLTGTGAAQTITYTPTALQVGTDTITYTLSDGCGTATGTIAVQISPNGPGANGSDTATAGGNLTFHGIPGTSYTLQQSSPAATGPWTAVPQGTDPGDAVTNPVVADDTGAINYQLVMPLPDTTFYRTSQP